MENNPKSTEILRIQNETLKKFQDYQQILPEKEKYTDDSNILLKVCFLIWAIMSSTYMLAQHYSGRHVDEYDGNSSGSGIFVLFLIAIVIGVCGYFLFIMKERLSSSNYNPQPKKELTIQEMYERDSRKLEEKIKQSKRESDSASCSIVTFIIVMGFFVITGLYHSCPNDSDKSDSTNSTIKTNNNNPLNKSETLTPSSQTDVNGTKLNDYNSLMKYINESKQQTDNKRK